MSKAGRRVRPLANAATRSRLVRALMERFLGIERRRALPALAQTSFESWFREREPGEQLGPPSEQLGPSGRPGRPSVVLFNDTFTNYYEPGIGRAAVELLEAAGRDVIMAPNACCGRPFVSQGLLARARTLAERNIAALSPLAERDLPILVLEPSCASMLQDEYPGLLPENPLARLVAEQTASIDEWIADQAKEGAFKLEFDATPRRVLYHEHCHQRALGEGDSLASLFALVPGCQAGSSDAGCCGMAGSFGFELEHYDLSLRIAEERLLPAVRAAGDDTIISAPGTSCRQQIRDVTGRQVYHPIEILHWAVRAGQSGQSV